MTNENPLGLPVAWRIVWSPGERFGQPEVTTDCSRVMDIRQLTNAPRIDALILATDYAALLAERDAAERIGLELQGRAQRAESLLRESRRWLGDGVNSDGLAREHWTPAYASIIDRIDAAISAMEGRDRA